MLYRFGAELTLSRDRRRLTQHCRIAETRGVKHSPLIPTTWAQPMSPIDRTEQQSPEELRQAVELSTKPTRPPAQIEGYQIQYLLGAGAFGEVWVGIDKTTGRRVAIKFYTQSASFDAEALSREVEKLAFLSADRYVVQLLDVGWDSKPPYFVMEYVESGSLDDFLKHHGPLPPSDAVEIFREAAIGLLHAHGKGVLHCDIKPANILLDQDNRPRLADFGQSRMSNEQTPALGTLFYMAPEQADLEAAPDVKWDVYALGAVLYCMLTGLPPHRNDTTVNQIDTAKHLAERLARYREAIQESPPPQQHRRIGGVDRRLAEIIDRCLAAQPRDRFSNVQEIIDALKARELEKRRRPLLMVGFFGPLLLSLLMIAFGWAGYSRAMRESATAVREKLVQSNRFAAQLVAKGVSLEIENYFTEVEDLAHAPEILERAKQILHDAQANEILMELTPRRVLDGKAKPEQKAMLASNPSVESLKTNLVDKLHALRRLHPRIASLLVCSPSGSQLAMVTDDKTIENALGDNFAHRSYFHGGNGELPREQIADPPVHVQSPSLSSPFVSRSTGEWKVAISAPLYDGERFLGVVAITVVMDAIASLEGGSTQQYAVVVENRSGENQGTLIQHPLYRQMRDKQKSENQPVQEFSKFLQKCREEKVHLPQDPLQMNAFYRDPLGKLPEGKAYDRQWIACAEPVLRRNHADGEQIDSGLVIIVQEDYASGMETVSRLGSRLLWGAALAISVIAATMVGLWLLVLGMLKEPPVKIRSVQSRASDPTPINQAKTLSETKVIPPQEA
jgi:eukaryotic-like serine/threonine-protein kinase